MTRPFALVLLALSALPCTAIAQAVPTGAQTAYEALVGTPIGGFAPAPNAGMVGIPEQQASGRVQLSYVPAENGVSLLTGGGSVGVPLGPFDVGISAGYTYASCSGRCKSYFMAGGQLGKMLYSHASGFGEHGMFTVRAEAEGGFGEPYEGEFKTTAWGFGLSLAFALTKPAGASSLVAFISPGMGYGYLGRDAERSPFQTEQSAFVPMLGGGVGLIGPSGHLGFNLGVRKIFATGSKITIGGGVTWRSTL